MTSSEDQQQYLVSCRCESAKAIVTLLNCLNHISSERSNSLQPVAVFCSPKSLAFHVYGKSKQIQSSVDMQASLFSDYKVTSCEGEEEWQSGGEFCVNLTTVLDCLNVLGTSNLDRTKVFLSYNTTSEILKLELLDESGALCTAAIPGMLPPDYDDMGNSLPLAFRSSPVASRIILKSGVLKEVISELDVVVGGSKATLCIKNDGVKIHVAGSLGECSVVIPTKGNHVVSLEIRPTPPQDYPLHSFKDSMRGLDLAEETCITMNEAGMVAIQHIVFDKVLSDDPCFVDYILCALEEDDDEDERTSVTPPGNSPRSAVATHPREISSRKKKPSIASSTRKMAYRHMDADDEDSGDDEEELPRHPEEARLFGSVAEERSTASSSRAARRRRRHRRDEADTSDASVNLLQSDDDGNAESLDVTARATPRRDAREDQCSSPELLYGQQH